MPVLTDPLGWFTLRFPEEWEQATEDGVTVLGTGLGTVFVGGGRHVAGPQPGFGGSDFLARFLRSIGLAVEEAAIEQSQGNGCRIYHYRREAEQAHWRYWSVTDDETALLISYTCAAEHAGRESDEVESLVGSVRLFHSARPA